MPDLFDRLNNLDNQQDIDSPMSSYCPVLCCPVNEILFSFYLSFRRVVIGFALVAFNFITNFFKYFHMTDPNFDF